MTQYPAKRELQTLEKLRDRRVNTAGTLWHHLVATITNPDLVAVTAICAIGLLIAVNVILHFPDFGSMVEQIGYYP